MNTKQQTFCEQYIETMGNATEAARRAGYSAAKNEGHRLMQRPEVQQYIAARVAETAMSADEVLHRLSHLARGTLEHFINVDDCGFFALDLATDSAKANFHLIKKVKGDQIELHDALGALKQLATYHGLFSDQHKNREYIKKEFEAFWQKLSEKLTPDEMARMREAIRE